MIMLSRFSPAILALMCLLALPALPLRAMEREVVISTWQGPCADGDFAANLATVRDVIRQAAGRGSDFVVFPETFLSGYGSLEILQRGARSLDDPDVQELIAESRNH